MAKFNVCLLVNMYAQYKIIRERKGKKKNNLNTRLPAETSVVPDLVNHAAVATGSGWEYSSSM